MRAWLELPSVALRQLFSLEGDVGTEAAPPHSASLNWRQRVRLHLSRSSTLESLPGAGTNFVANHVYSNYFYLNTKTRKSFA
jgi:hypothetical protein